jgi:HEAT repeat protein
MKKWLLLVPAALLLLGAGALLHPRWRSFAIGYLRQEPAPEGRPISYWMETLRGDDPALATRGVEALTHAGADALPTLIASLNDPNPLARERTAEALAKMGSASVPALVGALRDEDPHVRAGAARTLLYMGPGGKDALPILIQTLHDDQTFVRKMARGALGHMGESAAPALAKALRQTKDPEFRYRLLEIMQDLGPDASPAATDIATALRDKNVPVQAMALMAFEAMGPAAKVAIPDLRSLAGRGRDLKARPQPFDVEVRPRALDVLCRVDPNSTETIVLLISAMQDPNIRFQIIQEFGKLGPKAKAALPSLFDALQDQDPAVRTAAADVLWKIDFDKAQKYYEDTIRREPTNANAHRNLAWLFASCPEAKWRNGKSAVEHATKACELTGWKTPSCLGALAAAYAEKSDFEAAVRNQQKSLEISLSTNGEQDPEVALARSRLQLYEGHKPFREGG